jgi:hypothetical protein
MTWRPPQCRSGARGPCPTRFLRLEVWSGAPDHRSLKPLILRVSHWLNNELNLETATFLPLSLRF